MKNYIVKVRLVSGGTQWITVRATSRSDAQTRVTESGRGMYPLGAYDDRDSAQRDDPSENANIERSSLPTLESFRVTGEGRDQGQKARPEPEVSDWLLDQYAKTEVAPPFRAGLGEQGHFNIDPNNPDGFAGSPQAPQQQGQQDHFNIDPNDPDGIAPPKDRVKYVDPVSKTAQQFNENALAAQTFVNPEQTDASRQRQLEGISPFAAFLEQLEGAGLGGLTGAAGRFAKSQYQPLLNEFDMSTLMPLILNQAAGEDQGAYLDALRRSKTTGGYDEFTADEAALQREQDKSDINKFAPTFGSFVGSRVEGGAQASQLRQLDQLRQLSELSANQPKNPFASGVLNPSSSEDAELIFQLAQQGMAGRYSPLASQAISRYAGSPGEAFADYTRGNLAKVGDLQASAPTNNFAQFLGNRYGLF